MLPFVSVTVVISTTFTSDNVSVKNFDGVPTVNVFVFVSADIALTVLTKSYDVTTPFESKALGVGSGSADELKEKSITSNVSNFIVESVDD